ncbi:unnamed protein product [Rotaria magnacalcarata]|uniref:Uncharacterized protein n=4 Tax=Rotaria magnacalcarata TaxID=392030 RepID=A0A815AED2_9BILA|nr:unnamed protein product [Rotaria magnacalcarata]
MRRHTQTNDFRHYSFLPPSIKTSPRNAHYQYYDRRLRAQQNVYSNMTPISTYSSSRAQHHSRTSTTVSDLGEPISAFHDIEPPVYHQSAVTSLPLVHQPSNISRQASINNERIARASVMRERMLQNIQQNISEIDQELSSLKKRPSISHHIPPRLTPLVNIQSASAHKSTPSPNVESKNWPNKQKKVYQVVPRISSEMSKTSQLSTPKLMTNFITDSFVGQYHYGPEVEEIEINDNDPENEDLKSTYDEISQFNFHETFTGDQFLREQSNLPHNRALISVPEYVDNENMKMNESTEELDKKNLIDTNTVRPSTVTSLRELTSIGKLNIQDFQSLIQTAPEFKIEVPPESQTINIEEPLHAIDTNLPNTILSKPMKHSRLSIRTQDTLSLSSQTTKNPDNNNNNMNYFFSDFGNEFEGEEDLISIDPYNFAPPTESELISEDNRSNVLMRQSQTSLLNPHASQQQQHIENNNLYFEETEKKKIDATTKQSVTAISASPSMKMLPVSIDDDTQTKFERNNNNNNKNNNSSSDEHQHDALATSLDMNKNESSDDKPSNDLPTNIHSSPSISEQKTTNRAYSKNATPTDERSRSISKQSNSSRQRSASLYRSSRKQFNDLLSREQSYISFIDHDEITTIQTENDLDDEQQISTKSRRNSAIPVPLTSPDPNNIPVSTSRAASPERRNSISSIDQNILFTPNDIIDFDNSTIDHTQVISSQQPNTEHEESGSPIDLILSQANQHETNNELLEHELSRSQNQDEFIDHIPSPSSPIHEQDQHTHRLSSLSMHKQDDDTHPSLPSNQNQDELVHHSPSPPSSSMYKPKHHTHPPPPPPLSSSSVNRQDDDIRPPSLSNQNQDELIHHNPSPPPSSVHKPDHSSHSTSSSVNKQNHHMHSSSIHEQKHYTHSIASSMHKQDHNRLKSVSPLTVETKKTEDDDNNNNDLHLPYTSPPHSDVSDAKLTSVGREDTFRQPVSPDYTNNRSEKSASAPLESKLGIDDQSKHEDKGAASPVFITEQLPLITASQRRSKLSLLVRGPKSQQNNFTHDENSQTHPEDLSPVDIKRKSKQQHHVSYADNTFTFQTKEDNSLKHWRERINAILTKNHSVNDKYSYVASRVNSFGNFEYQPNKILTLPKKNLRKKISSEYQLDSKDNRLKKIKSQSEKETVQLKETSPEILGRLWPLGDGRPKIFSEKLKWNRKSKIRSYSLENIQHKPQQSHVKIFNKKPKWHSESRLAELIKTSLHRPILTESVSIKPVLVNEGLYIHQEESEHETKIFDINFNGHPLISDIQQNSTDDLSFDYRQNPKLIFHRKLVWGKKSKLKDLIWKNKDYQPKQSEVKIFHQAVHWNSESKLKITHSLNWGTQQNLKYWSEINLPRLTEKRALFAQYYDSKWNDVIKENTETSMKIGRAIEKPKLRDYVEENFNGTLQNETRAEVI